MGFWGSALYSNDCTADVRDDYKKYLQDGLDNEEAFKKVMEIYSDRMDTDEEPLVWYALADTQWKLGRLMPETKEKALWWIEHDGGMDYWVDSSNRGAGWRKTLAKLKEALNSPQPPEKKIKRPAQFEKNPWNVGDVYAYCFHTEEAKEKGYYGKFILIQKIGDNSFFGETLSLVRVFDKIYSEIPADISVNDLCVQPFDILERFLPSGRNSTFPKIQLCAVLAMDRKSHYPYKQLTYISNEPIPQKLYNRVTWGYLFDWRSIEATLLYYHPMWQKYTYKLLEGESIITPISSDTNNY